MRIAILSDPNNFHTQKWVKGLLNAGNEVVVFSFEGYEGNDFEAVKLKPPMGIGGKYTYLSYLNGGKVLAKALREHKIDVVNALNVTPFGVWAAQSGFHPCVVSAIGADILEYPPDLQEAPHLRERSWANVEGKPGGLAGLKDKYSRGFYRKKVQQALEYADLITGDNQHLIDRMRDWFNVPEARMKILRWGLEPELFEVSEAEKVSIRKKFRIPEGKKVVLSPRGAKAIYQADIILEGFAKLLEKGADAHFIMLSAGYEVAENVLSRARELESRFPNFVFMREVLPREDVHTLWNLVDVFVSAPVYDGYSASLAEGRYIGAVPVVNDIPGNREVIRHLENGWVVDPFDAAILAIAIGEILSRLEELQARFGPANREWILENSLLEGAARKFGEWLG